MYVDNTYDAATGVYSWTEPPGWAAQQKAEQKRLAASAEDALWLKRANHIEDALRLERDVYFGFLKLLGEEHRDTFSAANNYAESLFRLQRFEEAKTLLRKAVPMVRRLLGNDNYLTLKMRWNYARVLYRANGATLDDLREAVTTLEDTERTGRRVLGGAHPLTTAVERDLRGARAALRLAPRIERERRAAVERERQAAERRFLERCLAAERQAAERQRQAEAWTPADDEELAALRLKAARHEREKAAAERRREEAAERQRQEAAERRREETAAATRRYQELFVDATSERECAPPPLPPPQWW